MLDNYSKPNFITFTPEGILHIHASNIEEAKIAIKQLKIKKKEITLAKKQVLINQRIIRAEYTDATRRRGTMLQGGKGLGTFVRSVQRIQRNSVKVDLANKLAPLEKEISGMRRFSPPLIKAF